MHVSTPLTTEACWH